MPFGPGLLNALLYLLIFGLIVGLIYWLVEKYCPEPPKAIVKMIMTILLVLAVIIWLIDLLNGGAGIAFPYRRLRVYYESSCSRHRMRSCQ